MTCPPGQSFDDILQECVTHDQRLFQTYKARDCQSKNMFFDGKQCRKPTGKPGLDLFDDYADGVAQPQTHGNQALYDQMLNSTRQSVPCYNAETMSAKDLVNTFVMGDTCYTRDDLMNRLQQSFKNNEPFYVMNRFNVIYYPSAQEVYQMYKSYVQEQQRRGFDITPMPVIQLDVDFIQNHELRLFVTPNTQRFIHITLVRKSDQVVKTVGFVPRVQPVGLPKKFNIRALLDLIQTAYAQGRLVNSAYETRISELPRTTDPWNRADASSLYIRLFEMLDHVTHFLNMPRRA